MLQAADGDIQLGSGWQLAADTTIRTGVGAAQVDLTVASWDAHHINLRLETWGSIEVLVPEGVAVQMVGGPRSVHLESLSAPVPGGPVLRIFTSGPTGVIRIRHPRERDGRPLGVGGDVTAQAAQAPGVRPRPSRHRPRIVEMARIVEIVGHSISGCSGA